MINCVCLSQDVSHPGTVVKELASPVKTQKKESDKPRLVDQNRGVLSFHPWFRVGT